MSLKKLSIFVEGHTEAIFIEKLIKEFFEKDCLSIQTHKISNKCPRIITITGQSISTKEEKYEFLIYNSCTDNRVLSDILDQYDSLKRSGCKHFLGIRDLYPDYLYSEKTSAENNILPFIGNKNDIKFIFASMEIETWFLAETSHYEKLNNNLTLDRIKSIIDLDSISNFEEDIPEPAKLLNQIYNLESLSYKKRKLQVKDTINILDYEKLYIEVKDRISSLKELFDYLDLFQEH